MRVSYFKFASMWNWHRKYSNKMSIQIHKDIKNNTSVYLKALNLVLKQQHIIREINDMYSKYLLVSKIVGH